MSAPILFFTYCMVCASVYIACMALGMARRNIGRAKMYSKISALKLARAQVSNVFHCAPGRDGYGFNIILDASTTLAARPLGSYAQAVRRRTAWIYETAAELIFGRDELDRPPLSDSHTDDRRTPQELFNALFD
jgi:hypothetical protein